MALAFHAIGPWLPWIFLVLALVPAVLPKEVEAPQLVLDGLGAFLALYYALRPAFVERFWPSELRVSDGLANAAVLLNLAIGFWLFRKKNRQRTSKAPRDPAR